MFTHFEVKTFSKIFHGQELNMYMLGFVFFDKNYYSARNIFNFS